MQSRGAGGAETHCFEVFNRIASKGNLVQLVSSCDDRSKPRVARIGKIRTLHVTREESLYPLFSLLSLRAVAGRFYDVVVEDISKFPMFWPMLLSWFTSKPFVIIVHHVHGKTLLKQIRFPLNYFLYLLEFAGLKFYSSFEPVTVTVSDSTKRELVSLGFKEKNVKVIPNGSDLRASRTLFHKSASPLLVYFGRVKEYKRIDHVIQAVRVASQKVKDIHFIVAGKGSADLYHQLEDFAAENGLKGNAEFWGEVDETAKKNLLRSAWVYAIASMKEGFGISVIEAQALGIPVVAYDVPGIMDSVKDGVSGILVKDGDVQAMGEAIAELCQNKELREKLSKGAIKNAEQYDWNESSANFLKVLRTRFQQDNV